MRNSKIEMMVMKAKVEFLEQVLLLKCKGDQKAVAEAKDELNTRDLLTTYSFDRTTAREVVAKQMIADGKLKNPWSGMNLSIREKRKIAEADDEEVWKLYVGGRTPQMFELMVDLRVALEHFQALDEKKAKPAPTLIARQMRAQAAAEAVANL